MLAPLSLEQRLQSTAPKRILALDGGGIRGIISIEILGRIEQLLREYYQNPTFVLADYFDFIAGTSTGAIIGAGLAMGMDIAAVRDFYIKSGKDMFDRASFWTRVGSLFGYKYNDRKLAQKLQEVFGQETTLGSEKLRTLLMIITHNAKTDSPWPITNNPLAKYNNLETMGKHSNLHLPLWQLIRASAAAPFYFPPEKITIEGQDFIFVDGCITPYNNPSFQAFITATLNAYNLNWLTGVTNLLLVSIGTGNKTLNLPGLKLKQMHLVHQAMNMPARLMNATQYQQDMLCRIFGECRAGAVLDSEIEALQGVVGRGCTPNKLFTYVRYDFSISQSGLDYLGLGHYHPDDIRQLDAVEKMSTFQEIGLAIAKREVQLKHFAGFL